MRRDAPSLHSSAFVVAPCALYAVPGSVGRTIPRCILILRFRFRLRPFRFLLRRVSLCSRSRPFALVRSPLGGITPLLPCIGMFAPRTNSIYRFRRIPFLNILLTRRRAQCARGKITVHCICMYVNPPHTRRARGHRHHNPYPIFI